MREARAAGFRGLPSSTGSPPNPRAPTLVFLLLPATPVLFGLVLGILALGTGPEVQGTLASVGVAFGLAGLGTALAEGIHFRAGARHLPAKPRMFGRIVAVAATLETNVLFALVAGLLVLRRLEELYRGVFIPEAPEALASIGRLSAIYGLLAIVQAGAVVSVRGTGHAWFVRSLLRASAVQVGAVLLLAYQFLALSA